MQHRSMLCRHAASFFRYLLSRILRVYLALQAGATLPSLCRWEISLPSLWSLDFYSPLRGK